MAPWFETRRFRGAPHLETSRGLSLKPCLALHSRNRTYISPASLTRTHGFRPRQWVNKGRPVAHMGSQSSAADQPEKIMALPDFSMRQLLEAGVHFGHQAHRWNPKMGSYIFGTRNNIHIVDLAQTVPMMHRALQAVSDTVAKGGRILFVGTKRQAQDAIADAAKRSAQYYVNSRWLGGTLTNWKTISASIKRLRQLEEMLGSGEAGDRLPAAAGTARRCGRSQEAAARLADGRKKAQRSRRVPLFAARRAWAGRCREDRRGSRPADPRRELDRQGERVRRRVVV